MKNGLSVRNVLVRPLILLNRREYGLVHSMCIQILRVRNLGIMKIIVILGTNERF